MIPLLLILLCAAALGGVAWLACNAFDAVEARWFRDEDASKWPKSDWKELGSPKVNPNEWGPSSRAARCLFSHDIHVCGCGMYQCRKCLVCWAVSDKNDPSMQWRPHGYWESWEGRQALKQARHDLSTRLENRR